MAKCEMGYYWLLEVKTSKVHRRRVYIRYKRIDDAKLPESEVEAGGVHLKLKYI